MKRTIYMSAIAAAVFALAGAAHADMSIEQSQKFQSNGQTTTQTVGVKLSDFDPTAIAYDLYNTKSPRLLTLWGVTPSLPDEASMSAVKKALQANVPRPKMICDGVPLNLCPPRAMQLQKNPCLYPVAPQVLNWAAWGAQAGWLDPAYMGRVFGACIAQNMNVFMGGDAPPWIAYPPSTTSCAVAAYIQSYAVNPSGYSAGNMSGLIPLCEVSQQNSCGITGGTFDPQTAYLQQQAQEKKEEREKAAEELRAYNASPRGICRNRQSDEIAAAIDAGKTPDPKKVAEDYQACLQKEQAK